MNSLTEDQLKDEIQSLIAENFALKAELDLARVREGMLAAERDTYAAQARMYAGDLDRVKAERDDLDNRLDGLHRQIIAFRQATEPQCKSGMCAE